MDTSEGDCGLTCISISDPYTIKDMVIDLSSDFLKRRKRQFQPYSVCLSFKAQEFVKVFCPLSIVYCSWYDDLCRANFIHPKILSTNPNDLIDQLWNHTEWPLSKLLYHYKYRYHRSLSAIAAILKVSLQIQEDIH